MNKTSQIRKDSWVGGGGLGWGGGVHLGDEIGKAKIKQAFDNFLISYVWISFFTALEKGYVVLSKGDTVPMDTQI